MSLIGGVLTGVLVEKLVPILAKSGAGILADIVRGKSPMAGQVVDAIAESLGVPNTPEAIVERYEENPTKTAQVIKEVEASSPEKWAAMANADNVRGDIFAAEQQEAWWAWAWRPFWMWLLAAFWIWIMAATALGLPTIDIGTLVTLTILYLGLYMGGHTVKDAVKNWVSKF